MKISIIFNLYNIYVAYNQTAGPIGLNFLWTLMGGWYRLKKIFFSNFFTRKRRALQLVYKNLFLGEGHYAVVKLARHVFTGEKVAVKVQCQD